MPTEEIVENLYNRLQMLENQKAKICAEQQEIRQQLTWLRLMEERKHETTL